MPVMVAPTQREVIQSPSNLETCIPPNQTTSSDTTHKPDEAYYQALIKVETDASDLLKRKIVDLNDMIGLHSGGREMFIRHRDAQRAVIDEVNKKIDLLEDERKLLVNRVLTAQQRSRNLRGQLETLQKSLQYQTVEDIDEKILGIKFQMMTDSLTLKEEKKLIADIEKLNKQKPEFAKLAELQQRTTTAESTNMVVIVRDRVTQIRNELRKLRELRVDEQGKLRHIIAEHEKATAPLRDLINERDNLRRQQIVHNMAATRLQSELRAKETAWRAHGARMRAAQVEAERWEKTRLALEADKKLVLQDLNNLKEGTYDWKSRLALQVIEYLREQVALSKENEISGVKSVADAGESKMEEIHLEDGNKFVVSTRKKMAAGGRKRGKKNKTREGKEMTSVHNKKINHTFSTIKDFVSLGFEEDYPLTTADCPKAIERLQVIIEEQKTRNRAQVELTAKRKETLEARLKELESREQEHLTQRDCVSRNKG